MASAISFFEKLHVFVYRRVQNIDLWILTILVFLFFTYKQAGEAFFVSIIQQSSLPTISDHSKDSFFLTVFVLSLVISGILLVIRYTPSKRMVKYLATAALLYLLIYRDKSTVLEFYSFLSIPEIYYFDIIVFWAVIVILLVLLNYLQKINADQIQLILLNFFHRSSMFYTTKGETPKSVSPFFENRINKLKHRIQDKNEGKSSFILESDFLESEFSTNESYDLLNRSGQASRLAEEIHTVNAPKAFALGITGKWGSGKTYFLKMVLCELKKLDDRIITIEFNPWKSRSTDKIMEHFFYLLKHAVRPFDGNASEPIESYISVLSTLDKSGILSVTHKFVSDSKPVEETFEIINTIVRNLRRKIVVVIDDIDRLDKKEIIEVVRLIRNTANFGNCFFLAAYDRSYVNEAIKEINVHQSDRFLEKIFNYEYALGIVPGVRKRTVLISLINRKLGLDLQTTLIPRSDQSDKDSLSIIDYDIVDTLLENLRDVYRFCNSFVLNFRQAIDFTSLKDFFYLELIKVKYPNTYKDLQSKNVFSHVEERGVFFIKSDYLEQIQDKPLKEILLLLFQVDDHMLSKNSICRVDKFELYFLENQGNVKLYDSFIKKIRTQDLWRSEFSDNPAKYISAQPSENLVYLPFIRDKYFTHSTELKNCIAIAFQTLSAGPFNEDGFDILWALLNISTDNERSALTVLNQFSSTDWFFTEYLTHPSSLSIDVLFQLINFNKISVQQILTYSSKLIDLHLINGNKKSDLAIIYLGLVYKIFQPNTSDLAFSDNTVLNLVNFEHVLSKNISHLIEPVNINNFNRYTIKIGINRQLRLNRELLLSLWAIIMGIELTCPVMEINSLINRLLINECEPVPHSKNSFDIVSDKSFYYDNDTSKSVVEFKHPYWHEDLCSREKRFEYINWIAHEFPISLEAQFSGGEYTLQAEIMLPKDLDRVYRIDGQYCVDDWCQIEINNAYQPIEMKNLPTGSAPSNLPGQPEWFKPGINEIKLIVRNAKGSDHESKFEDFQGGNPYGIIFYYSFFFK